MSPSSSSSPPRLELDARTLRLMFIAFLLLAGLTIHRLFLAPLPSQVSTLDFAGETMGTTYSVRLAGDGLRESLRPKIEKEIENRLDEVDGWMSDWNPDSEIARFNAHHSTEPFPVSYATAELVAYAVEIAKISGAAFDITIGPAVRLWGFGHRARIGEAPSQEEIDALLAHMGARLLRIGRGNPTHGGFLIKGTPEVEVDLSAIAKGYGVDHLAAGLYGLGREDFLVEIGGEVRASGERPGGGAWRVAVEKPVEDRREVAGIVELDNRAMATSGDYRIFYREDGRRVSHTLDPRTGRPVEGGPATVTTIAAQAVIADAWATALMVMGEAGLEVAASEGVAAQITFREEDGSFVVRTNDLFPDLVQPAAASAAP